MTELELATLRAIAESAEQAARLSASGDVDRAKNALERAEKRFAEFSAGKPWHMKNVRVAREAVEKARLAVGVASESAGGASRIIRERRVGAQSRAAARATARAKRL